MDPHHHPLAAELFGQFLGGHLHGVGPDGNGHQRRAIFRRGLIDGHEMCIRDSSYFVEQADEKALAEAARKVEAVGGSVKLWLKRLPEED